jgi:Zn-dependent protease with chaperone function
MTMNQNVLLSYGLTIVGIWLGGLVSLFLSGQILSRLTLAAVARSKGGIVGGGERLVRSVYRAIIVITSMYVYISIPILVLLAGGAALGVLHLGYQYITTAKGINIRGLLGIGAFALSMLYTVYAVVTSVLVRVRHSEPGRPLKRDEAPALWTLVTEVANKVGTRPVDAIYITPGVTIAVTERGNLLQKIRDQGERYLILGLGALPDMTKGQFKAILAHEYGHFSNRDTAGGDLAFVVQTSIRQMAVNLVENNLARWHNPAWWFVIGFHRIFLSITLGASRLQEILADRYAAMAYSAGDFAAGLQHVIRQSINFDLQIQQEHALAQTEKRKLNNVYTLPPLEGKPHQALEAYFEQVMRQPTQARDSHPAPRERIRLVEQLKTPTIAEDPEPVWTLLPADSLQNEMMNQIRNAVAIQERKQRYYGSRTR